MTESSYSPGAILAGRYQIRRELGRGGMGIVFLCRDLVLDERVALKLLVKPGTSVRQEDAWWFLEEARALAALAHPAIVRARDFGSLADGTPYLAMDAVPGRSLHEWIYFAKTDGPIPWPVVWRVVDDVLGALAHAHARGVIHGDLKPSNVLLHVPPDGGEPVVHVLDLGLAWLLADRVDHRLDGGRAAEPTVRSGAGTPGWMAPEQIRFAAPHVGPATDLYSLGCILFAMLAGSEPFTGTNEELLSQHKNAPVPDCVATQPGVPLETRAFVRKLLSKRPWHRYELAGEARRAWRTFQPPGTWTKDPLPISSRGAVVLPPADTPHHAIDPERAEPVPTTTGLLSLRPSPFVARQAERTRLLELAASVHQANVATRAAMAGARDLDGTPVPPSVEGARQRFVLLGGEAGVGKSRLADWLCEEVHERAWMMPLRAKYRRLSGPLDGIVGAVTQHYRLERVERDVVEKVLMNVWEIAPEDDVGTTWVAAATEWLRPFQPGRDRIGVTGKRFALDRPELRWLVLRRVLEHLGKDRPILLWLDDLHQASIATFQGLKYIHEHAPQLPLLAVATVRSEAVSAEPDALARVEDLMYAFRGERLELAPLPAQDLTSLLQETLPLDEGATSEALARSKGNPLFALQLVHAWATGGHLELRDGKYGVPRSSLAVRARTTAELWEERLSVLGDAERFAALAASALGSELRREVMLALVSALGLDAEAVLLALHRGQILLGGQGGRLRWPHGLLQEHLLTQLYLHPKAPAIFTAAADALGVHPAGDTRRIVRHRVTNLLRAGNLDAAARLLHQRVADWWLRARDPVAILRDLALLDGKLDATRALAQGGELGPLALAAGRHSRWRAEALRHAGKLDEAQGQAETARRLFHALDAREDEAHALRLLGHIASDVGAQAQGRRLLTRALATFEERAHVHGAALCRVVLGEIDYLIGEHARARQVLSDAARGFRDVGDRLGRAQCLILQSFVEQAGGAPSRSYALLAEARAECDAIGYRLGLAQCDLGLAHAFHREGQLDKAIDTVLAARQSFRDLATPRGEAGCDRLLAMCYLDRHDSERAEVHARASGALFDRLADPWGQVEAGLLLAQIALSRDDTEAARGEVIACEAVALSEAEPRQHRHLTLAWLALCEGRTQDSAREIDQARAVFKDASRTGDHTPGLLARLAKLATQKALQQRIVAWQRTIAAASDA
jgi:serine/threonine protein kinase